MGRIDTLLSTIRKGSLYSIYAYAIHPSFRDNKGEVLVAIASECFQDAVTVLGQIKSMHLARRRISSSCVNVNFSHGWLRACAGPLSPFMQRRVRVSSDSILFTALVSLELARPTTFIYVPRDKLLPGEANRDPWIASLYSTGV